MWWKNSVFYEAYVDRFAGTFSGFRGHLGYLESLGIDCVHLLPFFPSGGVDGGYDVMDYCGVDARLGTVEDAARCIAEAKSRGIRVIIDLVLNHTSILHPWFQEAIRNPTSPKREYYLWSKTGSEYAEAYNPFSLFKSKNWIAEPTAMAKYYATFFPEQADLNWDNPEVTEEICRVMDFWIGLGVSGFRLDAASYLIKRDGTPCRHLPETHAALKRLRAYIDRKYSDIMLLAEANGTVETIKAYFGNGDECHMAYDFPLMQRMYLALAKRDISIVTQAVAVSRDIPESCQWATFLTCHDEISLSAMEKEDRNPILQFLDPQNTHPFKSGKSVAARLATALGGDPDRIIEAFQLLLCAPGSPVVYYGSEIGMKNATLPQPVRDTRWYVRGSFDWNNAQAQNDDPNSLLRAVTSMLLQRKSGTLACPTALAPSTQKEAAASVIA
ncbi:MAG: alpha-amylase family glycosyl hydrolase [bacterium]|nr:alpha-amylase family glycosyl hydrolase [bacterium]